MRFLLPAVCCAALGVAVRLLLDPMQMLAWDNLVHNLPLTLEAFRQVADGRLPAWNPYLWSGSPLLADPQSQALYPPTWLAYAIAGAHPATAPHLMFALHVAIGAGGAYALARALDATVCGALVAGAVYALNPYVAFLGSSFANELAVLAWLPWMALAALRAADGERPIAWIALGALFAALAWAAGFPQLWAYSAVATALLASGGARRVPRGVACGVVVPLGGLALSLEQILPFLSLWFSSQRADVQTLEEFLRSDVPVGSWPAIALPGLLGSMQASLPLVLNNWPYLGLCAAVLALIALARPSRARLTLLLIGGGALWLAGGRSAGLLPLLYDLVPGLGLVRGPYKFYSCVVFAVALLAGAGASDVERRPRRWHAGLLAAAGLIAVLVYRQRPYDVLPAVWQAAGRLSLLAVVAASAGAFVLAAVVLVAARGRPRAAWLAGAVAAVAVTVGFLPDLAIYARPAPLPDELGAPSGKLRAASSILGPGGRWHWAVNLLSGPLRPDLRRALGVYHRFEMTTGYSAFLDVGYARAIGRDASAIPTVGSRSPLGARNRVLDVLSARHVLLRSNPDLARRLARQQGPSGVPVYSSAVQVDDLMLVARQTALPRVRSVPRIASVPSRDDAIDAVERGEVDVAKVALVEASPEELPEVRGSCLLGRARHDAGRVEVEVQCRAPGFLVLAERHDPGWSATIDGAPAPVLRTYGLVLGVPVPRGKHRVVVRYAPVGFARGALASALVAALLCAGAVLERRRRRGLPGRRGR